MKHILHIARAILFLINSACSTPHPLNAYGGDELDDPNMESRRPAPDDHGRVRCGGHVPKEHYYSCSQNEICIDDPYRSGCGMSCDLPGICVSKGKRCGGFAGLKCDGKCVDDPTDNCDPKRGGADCIGICIPPPTKLFESMAK
jgi:hypothetical protein